MSNPNHSTVASEPTYAEKGLLRRGSEARLTVAAHREALAKFALDADYHVENLHREVSFITRNTARAEAWERVNAIYEGRLDSEEPLTVTECIQIVVDEVIRQMILNGADDSWSGRDNDNRRLAFDGKRGFLDETYYHLTGKG